MQQARSCSRGSRGGLSGPATRVSRNSCVRRPRSSTISSRSRPVRSGGSSATTRPAGRWSSLLLAVAGRDCGDGLDAHNGHVLGLDFASEAHSVLAHGVLLLVLAHFFGVVLASLRHRENLVARHGDRRQARARTGRRRLSKPPIGLYYSSCSAVVNVTLRPGWLSEAKQSSPCSSAIAATRLRPSPLPGEFRAPPRAIEALKDRRQIARIDPRPVVLDRQANALRRVGLPRR